MTIKAPYCEVCAARDAERLRKLEERLSKLPVEKQLEIRMNQVKMITEMFKPYLTNTLGLLEKKEDDEE